MVGVNKGMVSSNSAQWYTPERILEPIYRFFDGKIDLDPCAGFGSPVKAEQYFYGGDLHGCYQSGLDIAWWGNVFMNPPYGRQIVPWVSAFMSQWFDRGLALLPARTDTKWFQMLRLRPMCFIKGRLTFSGAENSAPFPSVIVMRSERMTDAIKFFRIFDAYGIVK